MTDKLPRMVDEALGDWVRLKKLENNLRAIYVEGRDLLAEIDRLREERDGWAKQAVALQMPSHTNEGESK